MQGKRARGRQGCTTEHRELRQSSRRSRAAVLVSVATGGAAAGAGCAIRERLSWLCTMRDLRAFGMAAGNGAFEAAL